MNHQFTKGCKSFFCDMFFAISFYLVLGVNFSLLPMTFAADFTDRGPQVMPTDRFIESFEWNPEGWVDSFQRGTVEFVPVNRGDDSDEFSERQVWEMGLEELSAKILPSLEGIQPGSFLLVWPRVFEGDNHFGGERTIRSLLILKNQQNDKALGGSDKEVGQTEVGVAGGSGRDHRPECCLQS